MQEILDVAINAARSAGELILQAQLKNQDLGIRDKGNRDYVTKLDELSEQHIVEIIHALFPHHAILAEESYRASLEEQHLWIIDPIDGTHNYIHGIPCYCVSIAYAQHGEVICGVIYDPCRDELFSAIKGEGATLNNSTLKVSKCNELLSSLLGVICARSLKDSSKGFNMQRELSLNTSGVRNIGSAALSLAYVAAGRFDGCFFSRLSPWDIAAGLLLVREAGGIVSDSFGAPDCFNADWLLVGNPQIHTALIDTFSKITQ